MSQADEHLNLHEPSLEEAAQGFSAVGSEPRLEVLLALVRAGPAGLSVGEIRSHLDVPSSTLTHHLRFLAAAGLVSQEKIGRIIQNRAAFGRIEALAHYLLKECCVGIGEDAQNECSVGTELGGGQQSGLLRGKVREKAHDCTD